MTLIDLDKLTGFEPFNFGDETEAHLINYISEEALWQAPKIDPVNHAEWIVDEHRYDSKEIYIRHVCSNCGNLGYIKRFSIGAWEAYEKDHYKPKLDKFCGECGHKMDLREMYEQYKRDWCEARGYNLEDMDEEVGINGECYACFDEWYDNEYAEMRGE